MLISFYLSFYRHMSEKMENPTKSFKRLMDKTSRGRIERLKSIYLSTQFIFRGNRCEFESHRLPFVSKPRCSSMIINADLSTWLVLRLSSSTSLGQWLPEPANPNVFMTYDRWNLFFLLTATSLRFQRLQSLFWLTVVDDRCIYICTRFFIEITCQNICI